MRVKGTLTKWFDGKGFGFIKPMSGGNEVFVHIKSFQTREQRPEQGCLLTFDMVKDVQGRLNAHNVTHQGERLNSASNSNHKTKNNTASNNRSATHHSNRKSGNSLLTTSIVLSVAFLISLTALVVFYDVSFHFVTGYLLISMFTFICYGLDKRAAQKGSWRTPEVHLQVLALGGGWPGAFFAQQMLRHKSKKLSFRIQLWLMMLINVGAFVWFFVPNSQAVLAQLLR